MTFVSRLETFVGKGFVGTEFQSIFNKSESCEMHYTIFNDGVCGVRGAIFMIQHDTVCIRYDHKRTRRKIMEALTNECP